MGGFRGLFPTRVGLLAAAALVAGWAGPAGAETKLLFWHQGDNTVEAYAKELIAGFQKANPDIKITLQVYPNETYKTAMQVAVTSGNPPDVFFNWPSEGTFRFVRDGRVADVTDLGPQPGGWSSIIPDTFLDQYRTNGRLYGVPYLITTSQWYYSKDYFTQHQLTPPKTFGQLVDTCRKIRGFKDGVAPILLGNSERWTMIHYMTMLNTELVPPDVLAADYAMTTPADKLFTDPGYVEALQKIADLRDAGCFQDGVNATSPEAARSLLAAGTGAMEYCLPNCIAVLDKEGMAGAYGMFPWPEVEGGRGRHGWLFATDSGYLISSKTANPEAAAKFVQFLVNADSEALLVKRLSRVPVNPAAYKLVSVPAAVQAVYDDINAMKGAVVAMDQSLESRVSNAYLNGGQELINKTKTPEQVVAAVRTQALAAKQALGR